MARTRKGEKIDGWINLDKPSGMTSTQAVARVRRLLNAQKAGHAGTLDPLATGILPIALGEATKTIPFAQDALKTYSFTVSWGEQRDTDDSEGTVIATSAHRPAPEDIEKGLVAYRGHILQTPPQYSALKIGGKRAYDLARAGEEIDLQPREVFIEDLRLTAVEMDKADFLMICGKGTYVRSIARDLARDMGTCGYVSTLRRERVGAFGADRAISLDNLEKMQDSPALGSALLPLDFALDDIPALTVRDFEAARLRSGQALAFISRPDFERLREAGLAEESSSTALAVFGGKAVALVEISGGSIQPVRVFNT
ncbi:MAG: tRNA pseudouridine(55) synthase TruB [Alphaproteobacteria bacterium]|nr:tRNA pseudouridine(55) synthase TruB [Alphaproteobacteria bacterium]